MNRHQNGVVMGAPRVRFAQGSWRWRGYARRMREGDVDRAPQTVVHYLRDLTSDYHSFYNACRILVDDDDDLRHARTALNLATGQVIRNGLELLGVSAPEHM